MIIRKAETGDIPEIQSIFAHARDFMIKTGNPSQWAENYPSLELINEDIDSGDSYVCVKNDRIVATFLLRGGDDPTYDVIDGGWISDYPYATIHRIASNGDVKGVFLKALQFALSRYDSIRIDTHEDNKVMQNAVQKAGFKYCGIIRCWNGTERLAYQYEMQTERIRLRRWKESDAESLFKYASDPDVGPRAGWPPHQSIEDSLYVVKNIFMNDETWAITLKDSDEAIGAMGYFTHQTSNIPIEENDCEIGYWVGKPHWNKGICTEALRLMLDYCHNVMHFNDIWSDHFTGNPASGRVMVKCGFEDTGKLNRCSNLIGGDKDMVRIYKLK